MFVVWEARKFAAEKKCVLKMRSESSPTQEASRMLKMSMPRMALTSQAHTVKGIRGSVIPFARKSIAVTEKIIALQRAAARKRPTLTIQIVIPCCGPVKKAAVMPKSETTLTQNEQRFRTGKAISRAPICNGRR